MSHRQIWTDPTTPEKKGTQHNPQHADSPIHGSIPSFSPKPINEAVDLSQATRLTGPVSPGYDRYVQYLLAGANPSVLNRHRRGYNLAGVGLPTPLPGLLNRWFYTFHLMAPPGLELSIQTFPTEIKREQILNLTCGTSPLDFYHSLSSKHSMS
jgi:hypothetical protein